MLYPRENEIRELKDLSVIWKFKVDKLNEGYDQKWYESKLEDTILMPVPSSYNDITQDATIRDHIGDVWYETEFYIPSAWQSKRVVIRVGSASHKAVMWINSQKVAEHKGGFLPFEADISTAVLYGQKNRLTIAVNNILDWTTLPPGEIKTYNDERHPQGYRMQDIFHDFFNYGGIHRPVKLYTTPKVFIDDITVHTSIEGSAGIISYEASVAGEIAGFRVGLIDKDQEIAVLQGTSGEFVIENARLWEPGNPYLYTLKFDILNANGDVMDCYYQQAGIRTIKVTEKEFLINDKPFYFKGFGKHEDVDITGKGLNQAVNIKDCNLLKWMGANSFRTSHYPYAEEMMELADQYGIVVINEVPAVGFNFWNKSQPIFSGERVCQGTLEHHLQVIRELVERDKNHPCVVMWSAANEAATGEEGAVPYFERVVEEFRKLDSTRPITIVESSRPYSCKVAQMFDVICLNRYYSWYEDPGHLELVEFQIEQEVRGWHETFKKPVLMTEYGADAIAGFHSDPPAMFSEEYQCEVLKRYHNVFDKLDFMIGEQVWNFADFRTKQAVNRPGGNQKGVFTRQRQPKAAAHLLRHRWVNLDRRLPEK